MVIFIAALFLRAIASAGSLDNTPLAGPAFKWLDPLLAGGGTEGVMPLALMLFLALATFVSEDLTCIGAGMLAAHGVLGLAPVSVAG